MGNLSFIDLLLSFLITWMVVLIPPAIIRFARQRPLSRGWAIAIALALYFVNVIFFTATGSQNKSHGVLFVGAIFSFYLLQWQTRADAAKSVAKQRRALGYDE